VSGPNDKAVTRSLFALPTPEEPAGGNQPPAVPEPLADDATVDLAAERASAGVDEIIEALDRDLVGLRPVKTRINEIAALLLIDRVRTRFGLSAGPPSLHMSFTGNPGTGKTTVALRMARLLHRMGYLRRGRVVSVTRDDLVGQYVGHTAPKTKEVLNRAMGGVLFIDEAYYLYRADKERDYGQEAIEILLQYMENYRDDLVVIMAGYADRMETFFSSNPGMSSRVAHHLDFSRLLAGRARGHRRADAGRAALPAVTRGGIGVPRLPRLPDDPAAVRQRAQRPQRPRARPAAAREPADRDQRHPGQRRPHAPGTRRLPSQPRLQQLTGPRLLIALRRAGGIGAAAG